MNSNFVSAIMSNYLIFSIAFLMYVFWANYQIVS